MQFRHIFRRANLCKWADPYPAKNESEADPNNNMAAQWLPNVDVFFESLVPVIRGARSHLSTNQVDSAEFWCRRLDGYERTLTLLLSSVEESLLKARSRNFPSRFAGVDCILKKSQRYARFSNLSKRIFG